MPLNHACLGKSYPAQRTMVTREAIEKFARACNDPNPRYLDCNSPGGIIAPPLFSSVVSWTAVIGAMTDADLGADLLRLLHVAQDMEFFAPIVPGDVITAAARITAIEPATSGEIVALSINLCDQSVRETGRVIFTALIRGGRNRSASSGGDRDRSAPVRAGEALVNVAQTVDLDQTIRYAEASGDYNPIHLDANVAKMAGLPGIVVHGLCTMALTAKVLVDELAGGDSTRLKRIAVRFSRPVFPGDTIRTKVWSAAANGRDGRRIYSYETLNGQGRSVIRDGIAEIAP